MEAFWLSIVLDILETFLLKCIMEKELIRDVVVGLVLKGLLSLHLTFGCANMCYTDMVSFPQSVTQWQGQLKHV